MKTKIILFFVCLSFSGFSQYEYRRLVQEGATWSFLFGTYDGGGTSLYRFMFSGDTMISNQHYQKLYSRSTGSDWYYLGALREDSLKRIYYRENFSFFPDGCAEIDTNEIILYDFGLDIGDVISLPADWNDSLSLEVLNIDTIFMGGDYRKRLTFIEINGYGDYRYQVEGVGSLKFLFYPLCYSFEWDWYLVCHEDREMNFFTDYYGTVSDCFTYVGLDEVGNEQSINIYPNPTSNFINLETPFGNPQGRIFIYNLYGEMQMDVQLIQNGIDISNLADGIYFLQLETDSGKKTKAKRFIVSN